MTPLDLSRPLSLGSTGPEVRAVQAIVGVPVDGSFGGGQTEPAVYRFNIAHLPGPHADIAALNVWGPASWAAARGLYLPAERAPWRIMFDASQFNSSIAAELWALWKAWNVAGVMVRLWDGAEDKLAAEHVQRASDAGLDVGGYGVHSPTRDPVAEAEAIHAAAASLPLKWRIALDCEEGRVDPAHVLTAAQRLVALGDAPPLIYASPGYLASVVHDPAIASLVDLECHGWAAAYGVSAPPPFPLPVVAWQAFGDPVPEAPACYRVPGGGVVDVGYVLDPAAMRA